MVRVLQRLAQLAQNESWAKQLPSMERAAVEDAIRLERSELLFSPWAILTLCVFYGLAGGLWGLAMHANLVWSAIGGVALAVIITLTTCSYPIFAPFGKVEEELRERVFFVALWVMFAIVLGGFGLVVWAVRTMLSL